MPYLKQIVAVRRKAGITRQEFFNYHFQVHGRISVAPSPAETPSKYFQIHLEDAAYHSTGPSDSANANPSWAFSDDITELYFESTDHFSRVFQSLWVTEEVGPDAANFSDFGASLPVTVQEMAVPLNGDAPSVNDVSLSGSLVAMYFIAKATDDIEANDLVSGFAGILQRFDPTQVRALVANVPVDLPFDPNSYFGSHSGRPRFDLVLAIHLRDKAGVSILRTAQKEFEETYVSHINLGSSWIAFGQRALVFDQDQDIKFDPGRQPSLYGN
ncbi:unnamed protein product [Clonostachys rhizophaga]|uniref:EthD domain-containing protein n=1 Tax=Clonostachys rhizophaga TaxID=160324 RepID=A0A9N9YML9_9HYPO|nr:unnamed protein product [Clonostachys rhizophaga]